MGVQLTVGQGVITHVIARRVHVDEEEGGDVRPVVGCPIRLACHGALHGDGPCDIAQQQADGAGHVHDTTSDTGDKERDGHAAEQTPAGDGHVDLLDKGRVGETNHLEEVAEEVGDERVSGPLGEETEHGRDEKTLAHAWGPKEIHPRALGDGFVFKTDDGLHLGELGGDKFLTALHLSMVLFQNVVGFL